MDCVLKVDARKITIEGVVGSPPTSPLISNTVSSAPLRTSLTESVRLRIVRPVPGKVLIALPPRCSRATISMFFETTRLSALSKISKRPVARSIVTR